MPGSRGLPLPCSLNGRKEARVACRAWRREVRVRATGWKNGSERASGAGYGLRLSVPNPKAAFSRAWQEVRIDLPTGQTIGVPLSPAFWRRCPELRSAAIGKLMLDRGLAPWPYRQPPVFDLAPMGGNRFRLDLPVLPSP
jgi:hypothetical protein